MAACRDQALALVGDEENCHLFYRCDMLDTATPQVTHWALGIEHWRSKYLNTLAPNPEIPLTQIVQSCGEMMFNPSTLVCDWPARVMQLRPECRDAEQLGLHKYPFHRARWPNSRAAND